jgi:hypothetical protein
MPGLFSSQARWFKTLNKLTVSLQSKP